MRNVPILILLFISCRSEQPERKVPNVAHISPVRLNIHRFDQALRAMDSKNVSEGVHQLEKNYPNFTHLFLERIIEIKNPQDTLNKYHASLSEYLQHPSVKRIADTVQIVFQDFQSVQKILEESFRYYQFYFPKAKIPEIYTYSAEYQLGVAVLPNNGIGIGLDMFLGANHADYADPALQFPAYIRRTFDKTHLPLRVIEALIEDMTPQLSDAQNRLIDHIIHNGKKMYVVEQLLPMLPDSVLWAYTSAQTDWCKRNEKAIWGHLLKQNLLYSSKMQDINKLHSPAPNSPGMPPEAPGRTGNFIGLQIVRQYMSRFPNTSLEQLLNLSDAQKLLEATKYKPL